MFSKSCEYAIRAAIYIYSQNLISEKNIGIDEISEKIDSPKHFTAKILQELTKRKFVSSIKGPNGGFFITKNQAQTTLLEIVSAIDGTNFSTSCVLGLPHCNEHKPCPMHNQFKPIKAEIITVLEKNNIEYLASKFENEQIFLTHLIANS